MDLDVAARLRAAGRRVTAPRLAVYDAVAATARRRRQCRHRRPRPARRRQHPGRVRRPAGAHRAHHHVVCRSCGATGDVDCAVNAAPCLEASDTHGFVLDEAEVVYWGYCPTCQDSRSNARSPQTNGRTTA